MEKGSLLNPTFDRSKVFLLPIFGGLFSVRLDSPLFEGPEQTQFFIVKKIRRIYLTLTILQQQQREHINSYNHTNLYSQPFSHLHILIRDIYINI